MQIKRERELKGSTKKGEIKEHMGSRLPTPHFFTCLPFFIEPFRKEECGQIMGKKFE